jgi:hypothetical protein
MAKKSRRARRAASQVAQPVRISRPSKTLTKQVAQKEVDFAQEYHYVIEDLKRIAITAVVLFILLIVAALLIS